MSDMESRPIDQGVVKQIAGEIAAMEYAGDLKAIAAVIVDKDGDLRTLIAWSEGTKLPLLAGMAIMKQNMVAELQPKQKPRDI